MAHTNRELDMAQGTTYPRGHCEVCGRWISNSGRAEHAHRQAHVRRGELVEVSSQWTWRGERLNSRLVPVSGVEQWAERGWVQTFAEHVARVKQEG